MTAQESSSKEVKGIFSFFSASEKKETATKTEETPKTQVLLFMLTL